MGKIAQTGMSIIARSDRYEAALSMRVAIKMTNLVLAMTVDQLRLSLDSFWSHLDKGFPPRRKRCTMEPRA